MFELIIVYKLNVLSSERFMSVLNHKEDVHFCTREWVSLSHYWRASAKYGRVSLIMGETRPYLGETRQYGRDDWVRLANYGRDSPIMGETRHYWRGHTPITQCYTLIIGVWPLNYIVYYKPMIGKFILIIGV